MSRSIFIDIKEGEIETYIFEVRHGRFELKDSKSYPMRDGYDFSIDLTKDIENACLSLPISSLNFRVIDLPFSDKDRIREILPFELDGVIFGGVEKMVFDNIVVGKSDDKYQVLAVYIEKTIISRILERLKSYNIDPEFITSLELKNVLKDFNLARLLAPSLEDKDRIPLAIEEIIAPTINLRRDEFSYTRGIEKTRKSLKVTAVLAILLAIVLASDLLLKIVSARQEIASFKSDMRKVYQGIFPGEKNITNELYQLKSHMKELKNREEFFIGVNPLNLLLNLSQIDRQGVIFNEITADRGNLTLKGEASSLSDIQRVKVKLERLFDDVNISDSKASTQGKMLFAITAKEVEHR
ncbi:MAG: GspL/Epsl periplasmic domain-containing protein [Nitrospirota bacterium]